MAKTEYPLEQLTMIKKKRLEEAERLLLQKKDLLAKEEKKLKDLEGDRDKVKYHKEAKLTQLRLELDTGSTTGTIQQMKFYLKEVDEKLKIREVKLREQEKQVELATKAVETAREDMLKKGQSVEKMRMHKEEWQKQQKIIEEQIDTLETEELGTMMFSRKKR